MYLYILCMHNGTNSNLLTASHFPLWGLEKGSLLEDRMVGKTSFMTVKNQTSWPRRVGLINCNLKGGGKRYLGCSAGPRQSRLYSVSQRLNICSLMGTPAPACTPKLSGLWSANGVSVFSQGSWISCTFREREEKEFEHSSAPCPWFLFLWVHLLVGNCGLKILGGKI